MKANQKISNHSSSSKFRQLKSNQRFSFTPISSSSIELKGGKTNG